MRRYENDIHTMEMSPSFTGLVGFGPIPLSPVFPPREPAPVEPTEDVLSFGDTSLLSLLKKAYEVREAHGGRWQNPDDLFSPEMDIVTVLNLLEQDYYE